MPGLYLHIPFCKKACHYCNFHFSTTLRLKGEMLDAIERELELQRDYLEGKTLDSIYFGGGTPSLLETAELVRIFEKIAQLHPISPNAEITLEANPDDLNGEKLQDLKRYTPVNRLSIGIQSFSEADLLWMNRAHNAHEARACLEQALATGFQDLTIDLIYGAPPTSDAQWEENLRIAFEYGIPHLSSYCLTVEEGTALGTFVKKGQQPPVEEEKAARQFEYLQEATEGRGYEQYEISNFALPGHYARHNTNYWLGESYLGIGPSAHSFNGVSRQWNIAHNPNYIKALAQGELPFEREILSPEQRYNELVMTSLRTIWGIKKEQLAALGERFLRHFEKGAQVFLQDGVMAYEAGAYRLSRNGKLLADGIAAELFW